MKTLLITTLACGLLAMPVANAATKTNTTKPTTAKPTTKSSGSKTGKSGGKSSGFQMPDLPGGLGGIISGLINRTGIH